MWGNSSVREELAAYRSLSKRALGDVDRFVLLVGGHDPRKNAAFAISLTPALAAMSLRLVVTVRRDAAVFRSNHHESSARITVIEDPTDAVLWDCTPKHLLYCSLARLKVSGCRYWKPQR